MEVVTLAELREDPRRIRRYLKGRSLRELHRAVTRRMGSAALSWPAFRNYVTEHAPPSNAQEQVYRAVADQLGLRWRFLVDGQQPATTGEAIIEDWAESLGEGASPEQLIGWESVPDDPDLRDHIKHMAEAWILDQPAV